MATPSERLTDRIRKDFEPEHVASVLEDPLDIPESLPLAGSQDPERIQAALVLPARGDFEAFIGFVRLAQTDWRDALVGSGLGNSDWPALLDYELGRR